MGASRHNPLSPAYAGPIPDELIGASITVSVEMSPEFMMRVAAFQNDPINAGHPPPNPTADDAHAVFFITGKLVRPSALIPDRSKWPSGEAKIHEILRCKYSEFIEAIEASNPHLKASQVEAPADGGTVVPS